MFRPFAYPALRLSIHLGFQERRTQSELGSEFCGNAVPSQKKELPKFRMIRGYHTVFLIIRRSPPIGTSRPFTRCANSAGIEGKRTHCGHVATAVFVESPRRTFTSGRSQNRTGSLWHPAAAGVHPVTHSHIRDVRFYGRDTQRTYRGQQKASEGPDR